jgi:FkbM family methyltransferase
VLRRSVIFGPIGALRELDSWREPSLVEDADVIVDGFGVFPVRKRSDDLGHLLPTNFSAMFEASKRFVEPGCIAIDAGANIGLMTVWMANRSGPTGKVLAVEMMPDTAEQLQKTIRYNALEQVELIEFALSDRAGETVTATVQSGLFGQASIAVVRENSDDTKRIAVVTTTLDTLTEGIAEIALMKMDLEGAEPRALRGAMKMLQRTNAIIFESWTYGHDETTDILRNAGYTISPIDSRNFLAVRNSLGLGTA